MPEVTDVEWQDPCARADVLRRAYFALISGAQAYEIVYEANGVKRSVRYSVMDTKLLLNELRNAEAECAEMVGMESPRRRYPMQLGARRAWPPDEGST